MALKFLSRGTLKGEKGSISKTSLLTGMSLGGYIRIIVRFLQFIMGIVIIGLYAQDLTTARKANAHQDPKWLYAVSAGTAGSVVALVFMTPIKAWAFFAVDAVVFVLFLTAFGIFGKIFISADAKGDKSVQRMKNAVWMHVVNMLLWFGTAAYGAVIFIKSRKARSQTSGLGEQHV
ncbi:hypothetical protein BDV95DRAFT_502912 [Massariosphaeria phaeospora]|uniref:MARVEL domain-containing protein n=1 Tax=Massariosphaeria phaeospora TaxID=100035 RepID=A0A7C8I7W4_9PLEO|nr:hypothetical protein BDV95DRAFT_502912 [Massariosphaeria phaeospora]